MTAIDPQTGLSFPLVSLLAPANHHDSHFLPFLVNLAQAMGIEVKLITADEAYHDKDGSLFEDTGASVVTPPSSKVLIPENVDPETGTVLCHDQCQTPCITWELKINFMNINVQQMPVSAPTPTGALSLDSSTKF